MLAMCPGVNERDFRSGQRSGSHGKNVYTLGDVMLLCFFILADSVL